MKTYNGKRLGTGEVEVLVTVAGTPTVKYTLRHLRLHSSGFEWGYGGSGPSDLALSLLADYLDEDPVRVLTWAQTGHIGRRCEACGGEGFTSEIVDGREHWPGCTACNGVGAIVPEEPMAWRWHQDFKIQFVAAFPKDEDWELTDLELETFCAYMREREKVRA